MFFIPSFFVFHSLFAHYSTLLLPHPSKATDSLLSPVAKIPPIPHSCCISCTIKLTVCLVTVCLSSLRVRWVGECVYRLFLFDWRPSTNFRLHLAQETQVMLSQPVLDSPLACNPCFRPQISIPSCSLSLLLDHLYPSNPLDYLLSVFFPSLPKPLPGSSWKLN